MVDANDVEDSTFSKTSLSSKINSFASPRVTVAMVGYIEYTLSRHERQLYIEVVLPNILTLNESREVGETSEAVRLLE